MKDYIPPNLLQKAKEMDLLTYLINFNPSELVKITEDTYSTKTHDSLIISNNLWHRFSTNEGGKTALDYLIKVEGYSLQEAARIILNHQNIELKQVSKKENKEPKTIVIPIRNKDNNIAIDYLKNRGIDDDIIKYCIDNKLLYQELKTNNVVFIGYDNNHYIKYAGCRSTGIKRIMRDAKGSSKEFSFRLLSNTNKDSIHLFESSIDLLSYATLLKIKGYDWQNQNLIALAGVYQPANRIEQSKVPITVLNFLQNNPNIKQIVLHFDNDRAGRDATKAFIIALDNKYDIYDIPAPYGKDINDYLCYTLGLKNRQEIEKYKTYKIKKELSR